MSEAALKKVTVRDLELTGKRVFVRVDFNVPLSDGKVSDDSRIRASLPTLRWILERGGRAILASHLGRPKGRPNPATSLAPVRESLAGILGSPIGFTADCVGEEAERASERLRAGEVLLLENLRFHPEEEKNDARFAESLARLAEAYVNDAFGSAHRAHASVAAICSHFKPAAAGFLMEKEIQALGALLASPARPYLLILGGAKVADKIPLLKNLLPRVDAILIGGAMAYTFLAAQGVGVGGSRVEKESLPLASGILEEAVRRSVQVRLPIDHRIALSLDDPGEGEETAGVEIPEGRCGLDIGPKTALAFGQEIAASRTILWNGPVGLFERSPFDRGSLAVARAIASSGALSVAGGGDTAAALARFGLEGRFSHVSTGGGASLEFLSGLTLPGVAALTDRS